MGDNVVIKIISTLMIPLILIFGLYVQFHGEYSAGGGFQAGVILAASFILYDLVFSNENFSFKLNTDIILNFIATGVALYILVGIFGLLYGGNFLDYSSLSLSDDTSSGQKIGIFLVEIGVGLTVCGVMVLIYKMFNNSKA